MEPPNAIDISVKALFRRNPDAVLRLAGCEVEPTRLRVEDPNVNLPELRADHVFIVQDPAGADEGAIYLEYQLQPDPTLLNTWFTKRGGLTRQLGLPVVLLVVYLERGDRATFPELHSTTVAGIANEFRFPVIRLWEHTERIESGELPELAPLLVLCKDRPTVETIREEIELIRANPDRAQQADLLALALRIASRHFPREVLAPLFREELAMVGYPSIIDDWIDEGKAEAARTLVRHALQKRFGTVIPPVDAWLQNASFEQCDQLLQRSYEIKSLEDLKLEQLS